MPSKLVVELLKACIFILVGAYLFSKFSPAPKQQEQAKIAQDQRQKCEVVVRKITKPDGSVVETTKIEAEASQSQKVEVNSSGQKAKYAIGLSGLKSIESVSPSARLGNLPLWIGADVSVRDLKDSKLQLRMEF